MIGGGEIELMLKDKEERKQGGRRRSVSESARRKTQSRAVF